MERKEIKQYDFAALYNLLGTDKTAHAMLGDNVAMLMKGNKNNIDQTLPYHTPMMLNEARIGIIRKGEANYIINLMPCQFKAGMIIFLNRGSIIQINQISENFEMGGLGLSDYLLAALFHHRQDFPLLNQHQTMFVEANQEEMDVAEHLLQAAWKMMHQEDYSHDAVGNIFASLLHYINHLNNNKQHYKQQPVSHSREVFSRFIRLVNQHCHQHRMLSFYASKICFSERYLGTLIKQESGQTAKEWIDKAVVTTACVMLKHTDKTIAEISDELNFANPSFFCKFFRRVTGLSPQSYREQK